jgi:hypothetical protein
MEFSGKEACLGLHPVELPTTSVDLQTPVTSKPIYKKIMTCRIYASHPTLILTLIASAIVGERHFPSSKYSCKYCSFSHMRRRSGFPNTRRKDLTTDRRPVSQMDARRAGKTKNVLRLSLSTIPNTRDMQVSETVQCSIPYLCKVGK